MSKAKVFVIMPFADEFFESYEMLKSRFYDEFDFSHAGDEDNQQNILADIIPPIYNADIVLADLTGLNPNVMYELGIAHSLNKKTIMITRDNLSTLPFDLKQYRAKDYSTHFKKFQELIDYLSKNFHGAVDGSVIFSNPVSDFIDKNHIRPENLFKSDSDSLDIPDGEKGFLDFLTEIEEDTNNMNNEITSISSGLQTMTSGINRHTNEIKRVENDKSSGKAAFIRKQTQKAADYISTFSKQLNSHTGSIQTLWSKIEKNTLGLLENKYASTPGNKEALIAYIKNIGNLKNAIAKSNQSVTKMKEASLGNLGIERSLNQSIRFLDQDLSAYLDMTEQMDKSIDRIIDKSRFVVGNVL